MSEVISIAKNFLNQKIISLKNDVDICFNPCSNINGKAQTPALLYCFSVIDLLGALYNGNASKNSETTKQSKEYMKKFMKYEDGTCKLLQEIFRHKLVHLSEPKACYADNNEIITWGIDWLPNVNHLEFVDIFPPDTISDNFGGNYEVKKSFVLSINQFCSDIIKSVSDYLDELEKDNILQQNFKIAMIQLYKP